MYTVTKPKQHKLPEDEQALLKTELLTEPIKDLI